MTVNDFSKWHFEEFDPNRKVLEVGDVIRLCVATGESKWFVTGTVDRLVATGAYLNLPMGATTSYGFYDFTSSDYRWFRGSPPGDPVLALTDETPHLTPVGVEDLVRAQEREAKLVAVLEEVTARHEKLRKKHKALKRRYRKLSRAARYGWGSW